LPMSQGSQGRGLLRFLKGKQAFPAPEVLTRSIITGIDVSHPCLTHRLRKALKWRSSKLTVNGETSLKRRFLKSSIFDGVTSSAVLTFRIRFKTFRTASLVLWACLADLLASSQDRYCGKSSLIKGDFWNGPCPCSICHRKRASYSCALTVSVPGGEAQNSAEGYI